MENDAKADHPTTTTDSRPLRSSDSESFQNLMLSIRTGNEDVRTEDPLLQNVADVSESAVVITTDYDDDGCQGDRDSALQLLPRERSSMVGPSGECSVTPLLNTNV